MRNQKDLNVDVHARTIAARGRTNGNSGRLQAVTHVPEPAQDQEVVGLAEILKGGVELTTRTQSGSPAVIRIPHSILAVLVTIALALVAGGFWLVSSITEMKTNLTTIQQSQRDIKAQHSSNLKLMTAYATNETNRINFMTGLLTSEQQRKVYQYDRANPRPELPDSNDSPEHERDN